MKSEGFTCVNCDARVEESDAIGTHNRNHCPHCLWSLHLDEGIPGDRKSACGAKMRPIGLTLKKAEANKYGEPRLGEIMVIHECSGCGKISVNRIAGDDQPEVILSLLKESQAINGELRQKLEEKGIKTLSEPDEEVIRTQLFGKQD